MSQDYVVCPRCGAKVVELTTGGVYWWEHMRLCKIIGDDGDTDNCLCGVATFLFKSVFEFKIHIEEVPHDWAKLFVRAELESM